MLRRHDSSAPTVGKLYSGWYELVESLKGSNADFASHAIEKHEQRWAYGHCSLAAAAYVVDLEFQSHEQENNEEVMEGFYDVVEKIGILKEVRRIIAQKDSAASDELAKKWEARKAMIVADPSKQKTWDHFPTYPTVESASVSAFCKTVTGQLALYRGRKACFARAWVMQAADSMPAYLWWDQHGSSVAELQLVSRIILATPASASICERINSEFAFVKDRRRNRLAHHRASKLTALFHNLRLIYRMKKSDYEEPAVAWTNPDTPESGITKFGVTHYAGSAPSLKAIGKPTRPALLQDVAAAMSNEEDEEEPVFMITE